MLPELANLAYGFAGALGLLWLLHALVWRDLHIALWLVRLCEPQYIEEGSSHYRLCVVWYLRHDGRLLIDFTRWQEYLGGLRGEVSVIKYGRNMSRGLMALERGDSSNVEWTLQLRKKLPFGTRRLILKMFRAADKKALKVFPEPRWSPGLVFGDRSGSE